MSEILGPASAMPPKPKLPPALKDWSIDGVELFAKCQCGADRYVSTHTLISQLGGEYVITEDKFDFIARRFLCLTCKERGRVTLRIVRR